MKIPFLSVVKCRQTFAKDGESVNFKGGFMPKNLILLALNSENINEKIKISPVGEFEGVDGRKYALNGGEVLEALQKGGVDIMLDKCHADDEAMGWFDLNSFELREDGIYASLALTPEGQKLVSNRTYRYISPAYHIKAFLQGTMEVETIASVGLVNRPNLIFKALNQQQEQKNDNKEDTMNELDTLKAEIEALKKENEALAAKIKELEAEKAEAAAKAAEKAENERKELIENAINAKELLPKRKDAALALNGQALADFMDVCKVEARSELATNSTSGLSEPKKDEIDSKVKDLLDLE